MKRLRKILKFLNDKIVHAPSWEVLWLGPIGRGLLQDFAASFENHNELVVATIMADLDAKSPTRRTLRQAITVWPDSVIFWNFGKNFKVFGNFYGFFTIWQNFEPAEAKIVCH